jgi:predicted O-methyltransferase YrrM
MRSFRTCLSIRLLESARRLRREIRFLAELRFLPLRVALFQWRAWRLAWRAEDGFSPLSRTPPHKLAVLLSAASGRRLIVELGTGTAWTAISMALADRERVVLSYDPIQRPERERYLRLVSSETRRRLTFVSALGDEGPRDGETIDLLYIDSSHHREDTIREIEAWRSALKEGSLMVFDDFGNSEYPGVEEAVRHLGLEGEERRGLFVHRV